MTAYLDSSVILRHLLEQPGQLVEWRLIRTPMTSRLTEVECLRTLDRARLARAYGEDRLVSLRERLYRLLETIEIIEVTRRVLTGAAQPAPISLGTLDAIHLSSATFWRGSIGENPVFATHDSALGLAARAYGFRVIGA
jgi:predicted nucleic acid-binding protein